jgi:hypothetical protein
MEDEPFSSDDMILLYGIVDAADADRFSFADSTTGIQNQPVELIDCGALSVLASAVQDPDALHKPDVGTALSYKKVVDAAFAEGTVLPMRFGSYVRSRASLSDALDVQADRYRIQLDRMRGYAEMGIRLSFALRSPASVPQKLSAHGAYRNDRPGTAYLLARDQERSADEQRVHRIVQAFRAKLNGLTTDSSMATDPEVHDGVSIAFLVPREGADAFREEALNVSVPGVASTEVVGPWAPYSFV